MKIVMPNIDVNDDTATITDIFVKDGQYINKGDVIFEVENTKVLKKILSDFQGYIYLRCKKFDNKKIGDILAEVVETPIAQMENRESKTEEKLVINATKKAILRAKELNIDINKIEISGKVIKTEDVDKYYEKISSNNSSNKIPIFKSRINKYDMERVVVIGAGKGAEIVIDILLDDRDKNIIGLVDSFETSFESYEFPLLGCNVDEFPDKIDKNSYDTVILSIGSNYEGMKFRKKLFEEYKQQGIKFTNAIANNVNIRRAVSLGEGNVIMHNAYIGTGSTIGDNNMISYGMNLGHHCNIGSHNLIAPAFTTAGCVNIGDNCIIMTGVNTRSILNIGSNVILPVGYNVDQDIKDNTIIK